MTADPVRLPVKPAEPAPPKHLSPGMKRWWRTILSAYSLEGHHLRLLEAAATAWDRSQDARRELEANGGATYLDRFGQPKEHPAAHVERQSQIVFSRMVRELGLDLETPAESRPPSRWHTSR
jgi:phage terminase small subunit